ncbi:MULTISPECIES: carbohydrate ABC transporter permease [unclassified Paenibacillus]|uniref:carbohydrate ABC transporter permease n=1 Tax=unclassified Paenibacillus TaxID=185978 RepID=UPI0009A64B1C|nr:MULTISPECIES: carbohydrate ABC transporter permease [unclassified Paenibacillus]SLK12293.1 carbohydrate ABC transporter membrane protein 2, CUT1 family [Paenibacillus sp. RU5A]SOC72596.1 carbohydrate ABC transporter membrane protein 2, CUT1 family [Paenibacillus sp. RU26A]SOC74974.1 carbohydrate ABC transporter membrane protein 2, CUT1 family [Paenibacillus sp. RU5M]
MSRSAAWADTRTTLRWKRSGSLISYGLLTLGLGLMVFPFLWMISTSFKTLDEIYSLSLIPSRVTWDNYAAIFQGTPFPRWMLNSLYVAVIATVSVCVFDSITGYILAKFTFWGKQVIFVLILSTLMVPTEMLIIPWYLVSSSFNGMDTYWGILFPGLISGFGIFLMKQFMESLPSELLDAARIDGMGEWGIFLRIAVPLVRPAFATLCILTFLGSWNSFIWPLIITQSEEMFTIPVGMAFFSSEAKDSSNWVQIMTGATLSVLPLIFLFLCFQKQIIRGIATTGLK